MIADLYTTMQNWRIYCRINKLNYSEFESRKSHNQTKLLTMELMDRKGATIRATMFGDYAETMSKKLQAGETYIFSRGMVKVDNYKRGNSSNASEYAITFTEGCRIQPSVDDGSIKNP